jgi:SAM-dependent methyltransferase
MKVHQAAFVREQYATSDNLRARKLAYENAEGEDPREFAFEAVAAAKPKRVLEVGGGEGELAERLINELGVELVGVDQSEAMVEVQRSKGIDARVGDVRALRFGDGEFDVVVAAWMLYHVAELDQALAELARVLGPGGVLVAVTNSLEHLRELRELAHWDSRLNASTFRSENGEESLLRHFANVQRRDSRGAVTMDPEMVRRFGASFGPLAALMTEPPLTEPIRVRTHATVFVANKAVI